MCYQLALELLEDEMSEPQVMSEGIGAYIASHHMQHGEGLHRRTRTPDNLPTSLWTDFHARSAYIASHDAPGIAWPVWNRVGNYLLWGVVATGISSELVVLM